MINKTNDKSIYEYYMRGFNDELHGTSSICSEHDIENIAYRLGAAHAIMGDDNHSFDKLSKDEILTTIKKIYENADDTGRVS
jgi:hypothetical protein